MKAFFRTIAILNAAIMVTTGGAAALAQQAQPSAGQATAQLNASQVLLDMVVHDRSNKPVLDLQPDQISITDNGQTVKVTQLRLVTADKQNQPLITLLFNRPGINSQQKSSNGAAQDASRRLRDAAARFLKQLPESGFQISVMDVWGRLQLQQESSPDHKATEDAVTAAVQPGQYGAAVGVTPAEESLAKETQSPTGTQSAQALALSQSIGAALMGSTRMVAEQQSSAGLACLKALVESERALTGRKAVVYFTDTGDLVGDPKSQSASDSTKTKNAIQTILGAANRAGVSVYVIRMDQAQNSGAVGEALDAYAATSTGAKEAGPGGGGSSSGYKTAVVGEFSGSSEFAAINSKDADIAPVPGTLDALVRGTGGFSFKADDAFPPPVKQLVSDLTTYYEATYALGGTTDGSFHAIAVKPIREGLKVRTESGYLALPLN